MSDGRAPPEPGGYPSEGMYGALGNETRLEILHALFEDVDPGTEGRGVPFSELFERVDYDTSANFSYHVDRLVDAGFVERTERGYALSLPGTMLVRRLLKGWGAPAELPRIEPTPAGVACPRCGTPARMAYHGGIMRAQCPTCAEDIDGTRARYEVAGDHPASDPFLGMSVPPGVIAGDNPPAAFRRAFVHFHNRVRAHLDGVCPTCAHPVSRSVVPNPAAEDGPLDPRVDASKGADRDGETNPDRGPGPIRREPRTIVRLVCANCKTHVALAVRRVVQTRPVVVAFYRDHGVDNPFTSWDAYRRSWSYGEAIRSEDPLLTHVSIPCNGDRLDLTVDERLSVVASDRADGTAP